MINFKKIWHKFDNVTWVLLIVNLLSYLYNIKVNGMRTITGLNTNQELVHIGATSHQHNLLTIFTAIFSHASLLHFAINMISLLLLSELITHYFSKSWYIFTYLGSGIIGNVFSRIINPDLLTLGASGSIFGLVGMLVAGVILRNKITEFKSMTSSILLLAGGFIVFTFIDSNVNIVAHLTGLLVGMAVTFIFVYVFKDKVR